MGAESPWVGTRVSSTVLSGTGRARAGLLAQRAGAVFVAPAKTFATHIGQCADDRDKRLGGYTSR